ncbi:cytochrome P450 [Lactifluus volemus]|nr:cytochrome P450 [Lactifluus volemus]
MSSLFSIVDLFVLLFCFFALQILNGRRQRRGLPYPPGPRDVLSFHVFGQVIVVLNSAQAAKDLLEKRSKIYSDRPAIPFYEILLRMGWDWFIITARYGEYWRRGRKLLDRGLRPGAAASYHPMQLTKTRSLLTRLLENPSEWEAHIELLQGELILAMTYGYEVSGRNDRRIDAARKLAEIGTTTALPGALLVNNIPFLRHIPEWLPWFSYKPLARYGYDIGVEVRYELIKFVRDGMEKGTARPSLALENLLEEEKLSGPEREMANETTVGALGTLYAAGNDTCELDAITGRERLPTFEDRSRLSFVDAMCKEILRWRPIVPSGVPHASTKDDVYDGYFIPKEPDVFKPERFLGPDGTLLDDPIVTSAFGWGKRICPGRHFVDATMFIVVSSLLSVFNIEKVQDEPFVYSYKGSVISCPHSFPCSIVPRDKQAEELIIADTMAR